MTKTEVINTAIFVTILVSLPTTLFLIQNKQSTTQQAASTINCDINQNGINDDYTVLLSCVQKKPPCSPALMAHSDLNSDYRVDELDLNLFLSQCKKP